MPTRPVYVQVQVPIHIGETLTPAEIQNIVAAIQGQNIHRLVTTSTGHEEATTVQVSTQTI